MKTLLMTAIFAALGAGAAFGANETSSQSSSPTGSQGDVQEQIDMHERMATMHKDWADCLRSGKSEKDCRQQAKKDCQKSGNSCSMMEEGTGRHHWRRSGSPSGSSTNENTTTPGSNSDRTPPESR